MSLSWYRILHFQHPGSWLKYGHVLIVMFLISVMGCGGPPPCNVRSCTGCCSSGVCVTGNTQSACGRGGEQCNRCSLSQSCIAGSCMSVSPTDAPSAGGAAGGGTANSSPRCSTGDECPSWYCDCRTGPPVNSQRCVNNRCQDGAQACPGACAGFGTCWLGVSSGGFPGGNNVGPSTCSPGTGGGTAQTCSVTDLGKNCSAGSECQSGLCFGISPSFICTRSCTTANDCPFDWICEATTQGGRVCMSGREGTSRSTSRVCRSVSYPDVGGPCVTSCSGGHCVANTCTHRCNSAAECPTGWTCAGTPFTSCRP
jgi:hypothetical protein